MPRAGLTPLVVVAEAERIVDEHGLDGLTLAGLAERLGVRQPSLYKHIDGIGGLRRSIAMRAGAEITATLARAAVGRARGDALVAMAVAHREWALAHPSRYRLAQAAPAAGDEEHHRVADEYLRVLGDVLSGFGLTGADAIDAIRAIRSAVHGFVSLELDDGFRMPYDVDASYRRMISTLAEALERWAA